ncbi:helix-turn-helix domain-containing protein [Staphylothermus hellenicus]|uniref:Transcriptional regulator TrmB n=1 Tax=Staphylothermus hellenicus (strain DSM 12710 / JCM 10830 / BK20S6-10-b1 / P8) TaxID=591019 RepID=D7DC81_STAHD|nr:helix-turn-helix domain-containing protein [Staphylothermus hellenicus]ADI31778.1 transcriptional regulator TrmB [Staphylothermus hellenicus DSM 12710]
MSEEEYCSIYDIRFLMKRGITLSPPLWRTLKAVLELKKATAEDLSKKTGRPRTIESRYLAELNRLGIVARKRISRKVYYIEPITAVKEALQEFGPEMPVEQLAHQISLPADIARIIIQKIKEGKL